MNFVDGLVTNKIKMINLLYAFNIGLEFFRDIAFCERRDFSYTVKSR